MQFHHNTHILSSLILQPIQKLFRLTFWLYATFFVRDKGIAKQFQRTKNVAEKKRTTGASPTAFFRSPSRLQAAMRIQFC
jgi:hypothetical protein